MDNTTPPAVVQELVAILNEAFALDPECVSNLIRLRAACNKGIQDHPTITVQMSEAHGTFALGVIGIANGVSNKHGWRIESMFEDGKLIGFRAQPSPVAWNVTAPTK